MTITKLSASIGVWQQADEEKYKNNLVTCRVGQDELAFATAEEQGCTMTIEQAVSFALEAFEGANPIRHSQEDHSPKLVE